MKMTKVTVLLLFLVMLPFVGAITVTEAQQVQTKELKVEELFKGKEGTMALLIQKRILGYLQ